MKYKIIIAPSSDSEHLLDEVNSYTEAQALAKKEDWIKELEFDSFKERDAFINGYNEGVGFVGDGAYCCPEAFTKKEQKA